MVVGEARHEMVVSGCFGLFFVYFELRVLGKRIFRRVGAELLPPTTFILRP
jgi:hypothetical protein